MGEPSTVRARRTGRRPAAAAGVLPCLLSWLVLAACAGPGAPPSTAEATAARSTPASAAPTAPSADARPPRAAPSPGPPASSAPPSPATPTAPDEAREQPLVEATLAGLDRRARVAQLFVVGVPLDDLPAAGPLLDVGVGGVFLAGRSSIPVADLGAVTSRWAARDPWLRPWVAADQEGGLVQTLSGPGFGRIPSAAEQARLPDEQRAALADRMGASLAAAGVNLALAPVADVVPAGTEAANPPVGAVGRGYGSTPTEVVRGAGTVVTGLGESGVTATLKHFPGLGRVQLNTDDAAGVIDGATTADDGQLAAFGALTRLADRPFVMLSSAVYSLIDPTAPALFSPVVVTDVLRDRMGFDGVVITDDVAVAAAVAHVPPGERAVRFLAAGGTLVLIVSAAPLAPMIDAVLARADADPAFAAQVDAAVRTALLAKARAGLLG